MIGIGHIAALGCAAAWGIASLWFARLTRTLDARALTLVKCAVSALVLGASAAVVEPTSWAAVSARTWMAIVVSSALGFVVADVAYLIALKNLGAGRGVLFVSLVPPATAAMAWPLLDERLGALQALGMLVTLVGVVWVVRPAATTPVGREGPGLSRSGRGGSSGSFRVGVACGVAYCVAQGLANVMTKAIDLSLGAGTVAATRVAVGALLLAPWLLSTSSGRAATKATLAPRSAVSVVGASVLSAVLGLWLGTYALRAIDTGVAVTLMATAPLFSLAAAPWITGERPGARALLGAVVAVAGVALLLAPPYAP